jgi:AraC family transcriptional regulator of adaptative response / DNA-3-methyladenine glycosylase II
VPEALLHAPRSLRNSENDDVRFLLDKARGSQYRAAMELNTDSCYQAVLSKDRRFDGWFFVAVTSTGIYCRPVCAVRPPKQVNCRFYASMAAAEKGGYRPCLRCRPELAPGGERHEMSSDLAMAAAARIEEGFLDTGSVTSLASYVGVSERHLRRLFEAEFEVTLTEYAQTHRLLLAKQLLTDTRLSVTDVAHASGFGSVRSLNALFKQRYGFPPQRLRKEGGTRPTEQLMFKLAYRPPFAWSALLAFLRARAIVGFEMVSDDSYVRVVSIGDARDRSHGWIKVTNDPAAHAIVVTIADDLASVVPQVLAGVRRFFDLGARPDVVDRCLGSLADHEPGMRVPGAFDGFEIAARAIIGQQVTLAAARGILRNLCTSLGAPVSGPAGVPMFSFPSSIEVSEASESTLKGLGILPARLSALMQVASAVNDGNVRLQRHFPLAETLSALLHIKGIGAWTAQYIAMRALAWPNAYPVGDGVLQKMVHATSSAQAAAVFNQWSPWRAYAVMHHWHLYQT